MRGEGLKGEGKTGEWRGGQKIEEESGGEKRGGEKSREGERKRMGEELTVFSTNAKKQGVSSICPTLATAFFTIHGNGVADVSIVIQGWWEEGPPGL